MKTKLVYVASPYTAVFDALGVKNNLKKYHDAYGIAKHIAYCGARKIKERNGGKDFLYYPPLPGVNFYRSL